MNITKTRVYEILEIAPPEDRVSSFVHSFILALILTNALAVVLESVASISHFFGAAFKWFEVVSVIIFTIEYVFRMWSCTADARYARPLRGRIRFALLPLSLVDLLAIAPFYVPFFLPDLRVVRLVRLLRIGRILRLGRYSDSLRLVGRVVHEKRQELAAAFTVLIALLLVAATVAYEAEHHAQPEKFSSIPAAMWWAVVTLTTVGYGDVFPVTTLGKLVGALMAILAVGMVALPTAIIGSGFVEALEEKRAEPVRCPKCGELVTRRRSV